MITFLLLPLILLPNRADSISFRQVAILPDVNAWQRVLCFDTDHDGKMNLIFDTNPPNYHLITIWEYNDYERYLLEDTVVSPIPYALAIYDVGYLDGDSLVDMVGNHNGYWPYPLCVYESPTYNSNPTNVVWQDTGFHNISESSSTDLDQDGLKEILFGYTPVTNRRRICVYENTGDNQYTLVWQDTTRSIDTYVDGDFDQDGRIEFIAPGGGTISVYECVGDNNYEFILTDTLPTQSNNYDIFAANDMDGNGKPEFLNTPVTHLYGKAWLYLCEANGDNSYDFFLIDSVTNLPISMWAQSSMCGDVDGDGVEEIVWGTFNSWHVYKATGIHQYEKICDCGSGFTASMMSVYDLNGNGYSEVIESGFFTVIWEIEGVRLKTFDGYDIYHPGEIHPIIWQKFDPPGADSFSILFSSDSGVTYDTIVTGLGADDTVYMWTIPDVISENCKIMIWAYGPPRPGEQVPRGVAWDISMNVFAIRPQTGIEADTKYQIKDYSLKISPNPFKNHLTIKYEIRIRHDAWRTKSETNSNSQIAPSPFSSPHRGEGWGEGESQIRGSVALYGRDSRGQAPTLQIYDVTGRLVKQFNHLTNYQFNYVLWYGDDDSGRKLPAGVYFVRLENEGFKQVEKVILLR